MARQSLSEDPCAIHLPVSGGLLDWPLSRAEKMLRLVQLFELEMQDKDKENRELSVRLDAALRARRAEMNAVASVASPDFPVRTHAASEASGAVEVDLHGLTGPGGGKCSLRGTAADVAAVVAALSRGRRRHHRSSVVSRPEEDACSSSSSSSFCSLSHPRKEKTARSSVISLVPSLKSQASDVGGSAPVVPGLNLSGVGSTVVPSTPRIFPISTPPRITPRATTPRVFSLAAPANRTIGTPRSMSRVWSIVTPRATPLRPHIVGFGSGGWSQPTLTCDVAGVAMAEGPLQCRGLQQLREDACVEHDDTPDTDDAQDACVELDDTPDSDEAENPAVQHDDTSDSEEVQETSIEEAWDEYIKVTQAKKALDKSEATASSFSARVPNRAKAEHPTQAISKVREQPTTVLATLRSVVSTAAAAAMAAAAAAAAPPRRGGEQPVVKQQPLPGAVSWKVQPPGTKRLSLVRPKSVVKRLSTSGQKESRRASTSGRTGIRRLSTSVQTSGRKRLSTSGRRRSGVHASQPKKVVTAHAFLVRARDEVARANAAARSRRAVESDTSSDSSDSIESESSSRDISRAVSVKGATPAVLKPTDWSLQVVPATVAAKSPGPEDSSSDSSGSCYIASGKFTPRSTSGDGAMLGELQLADAPRQAFPSLSLLGSKLRQARAAACAVSPNPCGDSDCPTCAARGVCLAD